MRRRTRRSRSPRSSIRIPTVNPPGEAYDDCARLIGDRLRALRLRRRVLPCRRPSRAHAEPPRINVVGTRHGRAPHPVVHLNGHFDVVPAGDGWTRDPFGGDVVDGRIYGRGSCDMKAGIAAALFAVEGIRRAGVELNGSVEISGTVDEESGGFAGVAWLAEHGRLSAVPDRLRHHPRAALRRSDLHRSPRRLLVRSVDARTHRAWQHAVPRDERDRPHGRRARPDAARAAPRLACADDRGAGGSAGRPARDAEHQRHRRRAAGGRHPDALRRRHVPRGVRSALPARRGVRRDEGGDRRDARRHRAGRCPSSATS